MKTIQEEAKKYAGISNDKYHNCSHIYSPEDVSRAFECGVEFAQRWIPVEEELPEKLENDIRFSIDVFVKSNDTGIVPSVAYYYFNEKRWCFYHDYFFTVTHWRQIELK